MTFTRAEFLKGAVFLPLAGWSSRMGPNILIILSDDQAYHTMEYMTKTVSALGAGLTFTEAYAPTPLCGPARVSLLTGLYAHNNGVWDNQHTSRRYRNNRNNLPRRSIGKILADSGYTCGYFGKFLNDYVETASYRNPGFSEWIAVLGNRSPVVANVNGRVKKTQTTIKQESYWLGEKARQFIASAPEPWFCIAAVRSPHEPYQPTNAHANDFSDLPLPGRDNFNHYDPKKPKMVRDDYPLNQSEQDEFLYHYRGQLRELMDVDDSVENLLSGVDFETTYVMYTSDNGYFFGEHALKKKGQPYEEGAKVPLLVRGPGMRVNGTSNLLVGLHDIAPTLIDLAGLEPTNYEMDGRSLVGPMFSEDLEEESWRDALLMEMRKTKNYDDPGGTWQAIRTAGSLYVERASGERELYDMQADPYQLTNLVSDAESVTISEHSMRLTQLRDAEGETLRSLEV